MVITIVGLGVIGGSYGLALKGKIYGAKVQGIDIKESTVKKALEMDIISKGALYGSKESEEIMRETDLLIVCLYPSEVKSFIENYKNFFKENLIITDTTGIKEHFIGEVINSLPETVDFVFAHPMAGREKKGIEYASRKVFIDANFIITINHRNKKENIDKIEELAKLMGFGKIEKISPKDHDKIISFTSQLPHAIAVSLINSDNYNMETGAFIGDSYRDLTRIANINENLWSELFIGNKKNLIEAIENFQKEISIIKDFIINEDINNLKEFFVKATEKREKL
ncbi:MAG: prephenate dehydrogenase [Sarcina sp.]